MPVDYTKYRQSPLEQARIGDMLRVLPRNRATVLEVGARDGYISHLLTRNFGAVIALDLEKPEFEFPRVTPVKGDATGLQFPDNSFDVVCCMEVLEHIPPDKLKQACQELSRVARNEVLIGVPYRQDTRLGRTTCSGCGRKNPPWGHVSFFDEDRLRELFPELRPISVTFVGETRARTNWLSVLLLDLAGNPWGTYDQEEPCQFCGIALMAPSRKSMAERLLAWVAVRLDQVQSRPTASQPLWIHILFQKP